MNLTGLGISFSMNGVKIKSPFESLPIQEQVLPVPIDCIEQPPLVVGKRRSIKLDYDKRINLKPEEYIRWEQYGKQGLLCEDAIKLVFSYLDETSPKHDIRKFALYAPVRDTQGLLTLHRNLSHLGESYENINIVRYIRSLSPCEKRIMSHKLDALTHTLSYMDLNLFRDAKTSSIINPTHDEARYIIEIQYNMKQHHLEAEYDFLFDLEERRFHRNTLYIQ